MIKTPVYKVFRAHEGAFYVCDTFPKDISGPHTEEDADQIVSALNAQQQICKQAANRIKELEKACEAIQKQEKMLGAIIEKGQGIWPDRDYIKDDDWHGYLGERSALMFVLNRLKAALGEEVKDGS